VARSGYDRKLVGATQLSLRAPVQVEDDLVVAADDQQSRGAY
jgi:hypothetical protein